MKKAIYIFILIAVSFSAGAQALPFTYVDYDPAALGKGGAYLTETYSSAYSVFGNPAATPFSSKKFDVATGYTMWQPSAVKSDIISAGGSFVLKERIGISLGLSYGMNPSYDIIDASGLAGGSYTPSYLYAGLGLSWRFLPFLSLGANLGYASSSLAEGVSYGTFTSDVFAMVKFGGLKASAGIKGLGTKVRSVSGTLFSLPTAAAAGVGYQLEIGEKSRVDVNIDAEYHMKDGVAVAGGVSYTFAKIATVRAGYRYGGNTVIPSFASIGAGVSIFGARLDVAYLIGGKTSPMSNTLCAGLCWGF